VNKKSLISPVACRGWRRSQSTKRRGELQSIRQKKLDGRGEKRDGGKEGVAAHDQKGGRRCDLRDMVCSTEKLRQKREEKQDTSSRGKEKIRILKKQTHTSSALPGAESEEKDCF